MAAAILSSFFSFGGCKRFFYAPAIRINPLSDCCSFQTSSFRPLNKGQCFPIKRYFSIRGSIPMLLLWSFPLNISRLIIAFIVNSSKRVLFAGCISNIIKKVGKFLPSFAYGNSSSSVSWVSVHRRVFAASNHGMPCVPFFCSAVRSTMPMFNFHNYSDDVKCHAILHVSELGG